MKKFLLTAIVAGAGITMTVNVRADLLYQNTTTQTGSILSGFVNGQQIGQEIYLGILTPEYLTNFSLEYYSPDSSWSGTVTADVRFYLNNGALTNGYATPSSLFYDSGSIAFPNPIAFNGNSLSNTLVATFELSDLLFPPIGGYGLDPNLALPTNFTFTVTFAGLTGGETVGLPIFNPPTVGTNYGDYWFDASGNWELLTNAVPVGIAAEFNGSPTPTPEPSVLCLGVLGGAALAVLARRRQRRG